MCIQYTSVHLSVYVRFVCMHAGYCTRVRMPLLEPFLMVSRGIRFLLVAGAVGMTHTHTHICMQAHTVLGKTDTYKWDSLKQCLIVSSILKLLLLIETFLV